MTSFWVTYTVISPEHQQLLDIASCVVERPSAPRDEMEVTRLADGITDAQRSRGRIPADAHVCIIAWSPMARR